LVLIVAVSKGDFVVVDYTGTTGGKLFDTSVEAAAKAAGIDTRERAFRPLVVEAGAGELIPGFDNALIGMDKGQKKHVTLPPADAYGERDPGLVRVVPLNVFTANRLNPFPGMVVDLDGMPARVQSVSGGRVRVDFNHELAGKTLEFDIEVRDVLKERDAKIRALADTFFGKNADVEIAAAKVTVKPKSEVLTTREYAAAKARFVATMQAKFKDVPVEFAEQFNKA
jgi:FKBP-type peptidyl-prolyl cis-trans isomerase SlyD